MSAKTFSSDAARWLLDQLAAQGVAAETLLAGTGLGRDWLADPTASLSAEQYDRLVGNALRASRSPALGLAAARQLEYVSRFGFWGYAILSSATWREASQLALRYWEVPGSLVRAVFREEGKRCSWEAFPAFVPMHEKVLVFAIEKAMSSLFATVTFVTGAPPPVVEIRLSYPPPPHAALYREYWPYPIHFDAGCNRVTMEASVLDRPVLTANPQVAEVCQVQCRELLARLRDCDELVEGIRRLIVASPGRFPRETDMAAKLAMSDRTLRRRLRERSTTYQEILDEVRAELALGYLASTSLSVDEIASLLGFTETTAFRRAFKKWSGRNVGEVRRARAQASSEPETASSR